MTPTPVLLVLAPNAWEGPWMNRQQLLSRLGVHYPIVYSTGLPQRGRRKGPDGGIVVGRLEPQDHVLLDRLPSWLFRPARSTWLRDAADGVAVRRWRAMARRLGQGPLVAYVFHPKFWPLVQRLRPDRVVYHAYDLYHLQGKVQHSFDEQEHALVRRADLVVASSSAIADHLKSIGAPRVALIENAVDFDHFAAVPLENATDPADLAAIAHPRVGYTGALNRKVDFGLLASLSARLPHVQFVLVGQVGRVGADGERALDQLRARSNVHLVGFKEPRVLPGYMAAMDVNIMSYRLGDDVWTAGIYPLKLHEYLAVGRPVVSTDLPAVRPFADVIRIADDEEDWVAAIGDAIDGQSTGTPAARRQRARENGWNARARQLHTELQAIVEGPRAVAANQSRQAGD